MTDKTLQEQLAEIQKNLKAPKTNTNNFGGYKYRSCEDILEAVKPLLNGNLLLLSDEVVNIGTENYVKAVAMFTNGKDEIVTTAYAREAREKKGMDVAQITGSASSYARKYALSGLFAIDDEKDADTRDNTENAVESHPSAPTRFDNRTQGEPRKKELEAEAAKNKFCELHQKEMKERTFDGQIYYDHRMQIDGVWNKCAGAGWKADKPFTTPERDINEDVNDYLG